MRTLFYPALFLAPALGCAAAPPQPAQAAPAFKLPVQDKAKSVAETVYNTWRVSMQRGNESSWRSSTSTARQTKIRNMIVSQKQAFPGDLFRKQPPPPALENFRFVGALAGAQGQTMACTYLGSLQLGDGAPAPNAYVLQLVCERGSWKLDQANFFRLDKLPKVLKRLEAKDLSVLQEQDGFRPYESVPAAPAACKAPELIGKVFVDCPGRSVDLRINGISTHSFADERRADVISGGLRRGQNNISYHITPVAGQPHPSFAIGIFVMPETPGNRPVCVFDHILDAEDKAEGGSFTFSIDNAAIGSMNPKYTGPKPEPLHAVPLKPKKP